MRQLGLGWDRGRITIPIRDGRGELTGVLRYQPVDTGRPKMLAVPGTRLGLIPHPATETAQHILLVEGPPDMIAARSRAIPARSPSPATTPGVPNGQPCSPTAPSRS